MAAHIEGALYHERMGRDGPVMAFVHPNPMDQSCWLFQMAHLFTGTAALPSIFGATAARRRQLPG